MDNITIACAWESNLSVNDRYTHSGRPRLRPEVQAWQEELAWEIKSSIAHLDIELGPQVVVDVEMFFPDDGRTRDADNYFKSIMDAVEMGSGINDSNFIPFLRSAQTVEEAEIGFLVRLYSASFGGRNRTGTIAHVVEGDTIIVLDQSLPVEFDRTRVAVNLGVIHANDE